MPIPSVCLQRADRLHQLPPKYRSFLAWTCRSFSHTLVFYISPCHYQSHSLPERSTSRSLVLLWLLRSIYWQLRQHFQMKTRYAVPYKLQCTTYPKNVVLWRCLRKFPSNSDSPVAIGQHHLSPQALARGSQRLSAALYPSGISSKVSGSICVAIV